MERCPTCQARLRDETVCPRCRTDLTVLLAIAAAADTELQNAVACLAVNDRAAASAALQRALSLRKTPIAEQLHNWLIAAPNGGLYPAMPFTSRDPALDVYQE